MKLEAEILMNASPAKVWSILTDFEKYPDWNPFIKHIKGIVQKGKQIRVRIEPPGAKAMEFKPTVLVFDTNKELRWLGRLFFQGLFDGEHSFTIIDNKNDTVTFIQAEKFKGVLVPLLKKQLNNNTRQGFALMNKKLKELAEDQEG